jgi:hypothetical protein
MAVSVDVASLRPVMCDDLIRLGNANDGGYVVPRSAVERSSYLLSFGLSLDWSFEEDFVRHHPGVHLDCYDHTVSRWRLAKHSWRNWRRGLFRPTAERQREARRLFDYLQFFQGSVRHLRRRIWDTREGGSFTLHDAFARVPSGAPVFLKVDIEGAEYRVLDQILEYADRIEALAIEFHDTDGRAEQFNAAIAQLRRAFYIVHIHGNNYRSLGATGFPRVVEVTWLPHRAFPAPPAPTTRSYPVAGLDAPNNPAHPDHPLRFEA